MLQQEHPEDFVIATGEQHSVRDFVNAAATKLTRRFHGGARVLMKLALLEVRTLSRWTLVISVQPKLKHFFELRAKSKPIRAGYPR